MRNELKGWVIPASVGITSFALGIVTGYFGYKKINNKSRLQNLEAQIQDLNAKDEERESDVAQLHFEFAEYDEKFRVSLQQADRVIRKIKDDGQEFLNKLSPDSEVVLVASKDFPTIDESDDENVEVEEDEDDENVEVGTVFKLIDDDWDYEVEVPKRTPTTPYVIHRDEFFADEKGYDNQTTLTFYSGDNVLCDENDTPVYNPEKIVGVLEFGKGSGDPNVVYVRNERLEAEYEILLDTGFYQLEVLGGQTEAMLKANDLKHSVYKFRPE